MVEVWSHYQLLPCYLHLSRAYPHSPALLVRSLSKPPVHTQPLSSPTSPPRLQTCRGYRGARHSGWWRTPLQEVNGSSFNDFTEIQFARKDFLHLTPTVQRLKKQEWTHFLCFHRIRESKKKNLKKNQIKTVNNEKYSRQIALFFALSILTSLQGYEGGTRSFIW